MHQVRMATLEVLEVLEQGGGRIRMVVLEAVEEAVVPEVLEAR